MNHFINTWPVLRNLLVIGSMWLPGIYQRHPFSSVASSMGNQKPTKLSGSLYRNVPSWWGVTSPPRNLIKKINLKISLLYFTYSWIFENVHSLNNCRISEAETSRDELNFLREWNFSIFKICHNSSPSPKSKD